MHLSLHPKLSLLAAALFGAFGAHAQNAPPKTDDKALVQQVEVKGSATAYDPRRDDTASKIVINHEELVKYGDTNVLDVLKRVPGVTVSGAAGRGGEIRMRGLGSGYTQILINGERAPAGFSFDSLAPDAIERIEVLRAASAEFSTQSIAGTINIVLKKAITTAQRELKLGVAGGQGYINPNLNLQLSDKAGQASYSVSLNVNRNHFDRVAISETDGSSVLGAPTLQREERIHQRANADSINLAPRLNWTLDNGDTVTWQNFVNYNRFRGHIDSLTETALGQPPLYPFIDWRLVNQNLMLRSDLNWVRKFESGSKLDMKLGVMDLTLRNDSYRLGFAAPGGLLKLDNYVKSRGSENGWTSTGKYTSAAVEGHTLAFGWDGGASTRDDRRVQRELPVNDTDESYTGEVARFAAFAQDEWNVTPRWSVYTGVRWEGIVTDTSGNTFAGARSRSSVWSPIFQTLYKLPETKGDQLRLALTRTYKAPTLQNLIPRRFTVANNSSTEPDFAGNADLKPELATGIDASYEHYWGEGALISVSGSVRRIDGYTRNRIRLGEDGRWVTRPVNDGTASTRTLEFEAKFPINALNVRFSVSRNWSTVDAVAGPNNRLDQQTPLSSTLGLDYKQGALTTGGSYAFRTGGPVRISVNESAYQTARRDLELYALYKLDARYQLRTVLSNILGQDYINENSYADAQTGTVRQRTIFAASAALRVTLEMKF